jgi:hypothetical protein
MSAFLRKFCGVPRCPTGLFSAPLALAALLQTPLAPAGRRPPMGRSRRGGTEGNAILVDLRE